MDDVYKQITKDITEFRFNSSFSKGKVGFSYIFFDCDNLFNQFVQVSQEEQVSEIILFVFGTADTLFPLSLSLSLP
jgi:hypothetical protein